jgi:Rps23 Pro-64 3,4-dihydroxylase Tpa1-like proline 4-hydroxylase
MDHSAESVDDAAFEVSAGFAPSIETDRVFTKGALSRARAAELRQKFSTAKPFQHVVIDQLFQPEFLEKILEDFSVGFGDWVRYNTKDEVKRGTRPNAKLGAGSQRYFDVIHRGQFVQFLSAVTGIDGLLPDPSLFGGGLHEIPSGGRFSVHTDFNRHPVTALDNRLVFITYLNKDWEASYGGRLELWDAESQQCVSEVVPLFGRSILFAHTPNSLHGHPNPVAAPGDRPRRSVAAYFYTNGGPGADVEETHTTRFVSSPQFGRWGKVVVTANYVSPMLMDGARMAVRMGTKLLRR